MISQKDLYSLSKEEQIKMLSEDLDVFKTYFSSYHYITNSDEKSRILQSITTKYNVNIIYTQGYGISTSIYTSTFEDSFSVFTFEYVDIKENPTKYLSHPNVDTSKLAYIIIRKNYIVI
jgi:hypothetical protein